MGKACILYIRSYRSDYNICRVGHQSPASRRGTVLILDRLLVMETSSAPHSKPILFHESLNLIKHLPSRIMKIDRMTSARNNIAL